MGIGVFDAGRIAQAGTRVPIMPQGLMEGDDLALVTGASGFVGSAIAKALRASGSRVRVLVREGSPRINIDPSDEVAVGDICNASSVAAALQGVRHLFHAAADYRIWA